VSGRTTELLSAPLLTALMSELEQFARAVQQRGRDYAAIGRVGALTISGDHLSATVRGSDLYVTGWEWDDSDGWMPECTCPVGPYCKHAYAVACSVLRVGQGQSGFADPRLARLVPAPSHVPPRVSIADAAPARRTPSVRSAALEKLRRAPQIWEREYALQQLLVRAPVAGLGPYLPPLAESVREEDPDLRCWRLAQEIARYANGWLPRELEPYRDRRDLAARTAERARATLLRELVGWAERRRTVAQRHLRLVLSLAETTDGEPTVTATGLLTTARLTDQPRTQQQLQQLRNELRGSPELLAPDEAALLEWLVDAGVGAVNSYDRAAYGIGRELSGTVLKALVTRVSGSALATWAADLDPVLAARGGVSPGALVRLSNATARVLPVCEARDDQAWVDFAVLWPDGRQRLLDDLVYLGGPTEWARHHPSLVLADGEFSVVSEEPPPALLAQYRAAGGLPLPESHRRPILTTLATHFPHLREALAPHTHMYAVRPVVALDLRDDDWLQLRLFAHNAPEWCPGQPAAPDTVRFEYTATDGWVRLPATEIRAVPVLAAYQAITESSDGEAPVGAAPDSLRTTAIAAPPANIWIETPDLEAVEPAIAWLASTQAEPGTKRGPGGRAPASWDDRGVGWWLLLSARRMEAFAECWDARPDGVTFFGTDRLRRLLSGHERVTPRIQVTTSGIDWFAVSAQWESESLQLSDADLAKLRNATSRFVKLPSGWVRRDVAAVHEETLQVLADLGIEAGQGEQRLSLWQLASAKDASLEALQRLGADAQAMRAIADLRERVAQFSGLPSIAPPARLTAELRPYQQQGLDFLVYTSSLGIGAVLADDMGLGKTVQALAWLEHLRVTEPDGGPSLVVCPASVMHNWVREAERFVPGLRVLLLSSGETRHALRREIPQHDLIITNYALLRRDIAAWREIELRAAILDEAQNIKNPDAVGTKAALELRARHRLALTGTPLENRALDLWSIMHFVNPGYLGSRGQFGSRFDRLDAPGHTRTLLAAKLRPVLLRRMKHEVATDLPERIEERRDCELTAGQRQLYLAELRRSRALVDELSEAPGGVKQNKITILAALTRLRQICCHPALARGKADLGSGKFDALFELLEPLLAEGHKVLLFSQFVQCLKLLSSEMRGRAIAHHMLTGQSVKREQIVAAFQGDPDPCVFLISLKAGGTGLNLTAASYVVLFDPWWNPAVEAQAIDRTHRIGQDRTVIAYRMLTQGTIEEKIWEMQQRKAALARDLLGEDGFARSLTRDDLTYLLADA
jgi:superfamily II DNA or RNA helicase